MDKPKPFIVNEDLMPTPGNPQTWLPLVGDRPGETGPGGMKILFGTLRPRYREFAPSIVAYARAKIMVAAPPGTPDWTMTAHRAQVILPRHADERLLCPRTLFEAIEQDHVEGGEALGACVTMRWKPARTNEQFWVGQELGCWLARKFHVAVLLVQHVPKISDAHPHLHLVVAGPRRITPWGTFGPYVTPLCRDAGRSLIVDRVAAILAGTAI